MWAENGSVNAGTNVTADNNIAANNNIVAITGDIVATDWQLMADGRGVVMSSTSSRQKIVSYVATLSVGGLGAGSSATGNINISGAAFTSAPTAYVANVITEDGEYYKAMLVLENVTTTNVTVRVVNVTSSPISFSGAQWRVLMIGEF